MSARDNLPLSSRSAFPVDERRFLNTCQWFQAPSFRNLLRQSEISEHPEFQTCRTQGPHEKPCLTHTHFSFSCGPDTTRCRRRHIKESWTIMPRSAACGSTRVFLKINSETNPHAAKD